MNLWISKRVQRVQDAKDVAVRTALLGAAVMAAMVGCVAQHDPAAELNPAQLDSPPADVERAVTPAERFTEKFHDHAHSLGPHSSCPSKDQHPLLRHDHEKAGFVAGQTKRTVDPDEESGGLDQAILLPKKDDITLGKELSPIVASKVNANTDVDGVTIVVPFPILLLDADEDCLSNLMELYLGTDPLDPDTDGDGWYDGGCNERRKLVLKKIKAYDEQEDSGDDELYVVADDTRYPHDDLDDYWDFNHGDSKSMSRTIATRTRGHNHTGGLQVVSVQIWEDDVETWNEWLVDDLLGKDIVDLGDYEHGDTFKLRFEEDDWDYELSFEVRIGYFADPDPLGDSDDDGDGISEAAEYHVCKNLGGMADPERSDIFIEVDSMGNRGLYTQAKKLVTTRYHMHDVKVKIYRDDSISTDHCLTVPEARGLYNTHFDKRNYNAFRYAVIGEELWNNASGVAWYDAFFVDDSTSWIHDDVLAQTATFIHELGHTVSLRHPDNPGDDGPGTYEGIDTVAWLSYFSAMNYTYQPTVVDYSDEGEGGDQPVSDQDLRRRSSTVLMDPPPQGPRCD